MLSDKEIEKRMVDALEEGGRHTMDDLVKSTGIDKERIGRALIALEQEELVAHITLEGTCRFYINAASIKDPPKKARKKADKVPCPVCGELRSPMGMWRHVRACKAKEKASRPVPDDHATITVTVTPDYTITGPQIPIPMNVPIVQAPALKRDAPPPMARCMCCGSLWRLFTPKPTAELQQCPICTNWITAPREEKEEHAKE